MAVQDNFHWFWQEQLQFLPEFDNCSPAQLEKIKEGVRKIYYTIDDNDKKSYQRGYNEGYDDAKEQFSED